jgi:hypothetical protein
MFANFQWNSQFIAACGAGNLPLAETLIKNGADDFEDGMCAAAFHNQPSLAYLCIQHGANRWDMLAQNACIGGSVELYDYAVSKSKVEFAPANYFTDFVYACTSGILPVVQQIGTIMRPMPGNGSAWLNGLIAASRNGFLPIVEYLAGVYSVQVERQSWVMAEAAALTGKQTAVATFIQQLLAKN